MNLMRNKDYEVLLSLIEQLPKIASGFVSDGSLIQQINRTKCFIYFQQARTTELYDLIRSFTFDEEYHTFLQQLWYNALYMDEQNRTDRERQSKKLETRPLGSVEKYRIRKK